MIFKTHTVDKFVETPDFGDYFGFSKRSLNQWRQDIKDVTSLWEKTKAIFRTPPAKQSSFADTLDTDRKALEMFSTENEKCENITSHFNKTMRFASQAAREYAQKCGRGAVDVDAFAKSQQAAYYASTNVAKGAKLAAAAMNAISAAAAMIAIQLVVSGIKDFLGAMQEMRERVDEAVGTYKDTNRTLDDQIGTIQSLKDEYEELSKGVDENGKNVSLTASEYDRYRDIVDQIIEINPSLLKGYNDQNQALLDQNATIEYQIELLKEKKHLADSELISGGSEIADVFHADSTEDMTNLGSLKAWADRIGKHISALWNGIINGTGKAYVTSFTKEKIAKALVDTITSGTDDAIQELIRNGDATQYQINEYLRDVDIDKDAFAKFEISDEERTKIKRSYEVAKSEVENGLEGMKTLVTSFLNDITYEQGLTDLPEQITASFNTLASSLDTLSIKEIMGNDSDEDLLREWLKNNVVNPIVQNRDVVQSTLKKTFDLSDALNNGQKSVDQYTDSFKQASKEAWDVFSTEQREALAAIGVTEANVVVKLGGQDLTEQIEQLKSSLAELTDHEYAITLTENLNFEELKELQRILKDIDPAGRKQYADSYIAWGNAFDLLNTKAKDYTDRLELLDKELAENYISTSQYFDALNTDLQRVDFSKFTDNTKEATVMAQANFVQMSQKVAQSMADEINAFNDGSRSVSEYLANLVSMGGVLNTLTDILQIYNGSWSENGAMTAEASAQLDQLQVDLNNSISTINQYRDSLYQLNQIITGAIEEGSDEFTASTEVIAEDLANIVENSGEMADEIKNNLGSTTEEIAKNLAGNVANQELATKAIVTNTNKAIADMATSVGQLFENLGDSISHLKVEIAFGVSKIDWSSVDFLGISLPIPKIHFSLEPEGQVSNILSSIGSSISGFGRQISSNINSMQIDLEQALNKGSENFKTSAEETDNYNKKLQAIKDSAKKASKAQKEVNEALQEYMKLINHQKAMDFYEDKPQQYIDDLQYALDNYAKTQDEIWDLEEKIHSARKQMIEEEKRKRKEAAEERKRQAREAYEEEKRLAEEAYQREGERLNKRKSDLDGIYSAVNKVLDDEINRLRKITDELGKQLELKKQQYDQAQNAVLRLLDKEIAKLKKEDELRKEQLSTIKEQLQLEQEKYQGAHAAIIAVLDKETEKLREQLELIGKAAELKNEEAQQAHAAVLDVLDEQIKKLEEQKDLLDELYQPKIDAIQDEIDKLNEANDARNKAIQLEKAQQELERLKSQKTVQIYREGKGFVYETDTDAIFDAQEKIRELELQNKIDELEKQKEQLEQQLEDEKQAFDDQIEALEKYKDQWSNVLDEYEKQLNREIALKLFGAGWEEKILDGRMDILEDFRDRYLAIQKELADAKDEQEAIQDKIDAIEEYKKQWADLLDQYKNKQNELHASEILGADWEKKILNLRLDVLDKFGKEYLAIQDKLNDTTKEEEANNKRLEMLEEYREKWANFVDDYESEQDRYIASQILGANWEQDILNGRMDVLEDFKDEYFEIMDQLNDVEEEKRANEERIELLESYKEAWSDAVNAFEDEQNRLAAAQRWGADWEEDILNGRLDNLEDFRDAYIDIMKELEDWEASKPDYPDFDDWYDEDDEDDWEDDYKPSKPNKKPSKDDEDEDDDRGDVPRVGERVTVRPGETRWATGERMDNWVPGYTLTVMQVKGDRVLVGQGGKWTGWLDASQLKGYRTGTISATPGEHLVDEDGREMIIKNMPAKGRVMSFDGGEAVVPNKPTEAIFDLAEAAPKIVALEDYLKNFDPSALWEGAKNLAMENLSKLTQAFKLNTNPLANKSNEIVNHYHISKVDFPNVKAADEIIKAFNELPTYAEQYCAKR